MYQVLNVNWSVFLKGILPTSKVTAGKIGQWGPGFAPTDYVAHWCVIGYCVGIMAAHEVSQTGILPPPTPFRPTPPHRPSNPPLY